VPEGLALLLPSSTLLLDGPDAAELLALTSPSLLAPALLLLLLVEDGGVVAGAVFCLAALPAVTPTVVMPLGVEALDGAVAASADAAAAAPAALPPADSAC
jgi:hypothetical protein